MAMGNFEAEAEGNTQSIPFNEALFVDLPEAFVERKWGSNKLRIGMDTVNWGVVDGYSPSNVMNTSGYFHPLRMPKRGSPMVEAAVGGEAIGVDLLYIPYQPRAILPSTDSRWLPRDVLVNLSSSLPTVGLPDRLEYTYGNEIDWQNRRNNWGARLRSHIGSWDLQATHFVGASPFPKIRPTLILNTVGNEFVAQSPIRLDVVTYKIRNTGVGITHAGEKVIFRAEGAYTEVTSSGYGLQPWSWTAVGGVETNFDIGSRTVALIANYYYGESPVKADNYISSSYRLFDRTVTFGTRWPMSDEWTWLATALYESNTKAWFWTAGFENKLSDAFKWGLTWRDFSAAENGLIKTFEKNDHLTLDLAYYF